MLSVSCGKGVAVEVFCEITYGCWVFLLKPDFAGSAFFEGACEGGVEEWGAEEEGFVDVIGFAFGADEEG